ncbi:MAG: DUF952 domain-containing protein [Jatrophihabitans sp.]
MSERLFHLVDPAQWAAAQDDGTYRPVSLDSEGFIHLSFAGQVSGSANRHYRDASDLVVVEVDPDRLDSSLRVEDTYGGGTAFPHLYGPMPTQAVVAVHPLARDADGQWLFSPGC